MSAINIGAQPSGDWSSCHAIAWDASAPILGDRAASNRFSRQGYPWGPVVNQHGERFVDEGADFRNYTHARYGAEILRQPGGLAFQLFDRRTIGFISEIDDDTARTSRFEADTIRELAERAGINPQLEATIAAYNASIGTAEFDPIVFDGKGPPASIHRRATGLCRSTRRRTLLTRSAAGSPSPSAGSRSTRMDRSSTDRARRCPGCTPPARSWVASSTATIRAAPGWRQAPSSVGPPDARQRVTPQPLRIVATSTPVMWSDLTTEAHPRWTATGPTWAC